MSQVQSAIRNLVIANRILAHEGVVDAYGHVSIRHPDNAQHYLLSRSRSPELVEEKDIMEFTLDGQAVGGDKRQPYLERFIHGAIYAARPEVRAALATRCAEVAFDNGAQDAANWIVAHCAAPTGAGA